MYARAWFLLLPRCVWAVNILQHALTPIGILIRFDVAIFALFKQTHTEMKFNINADATEVWNEKTIAFARSMEEYGKLWLQDETGPKCPTPSAICHNTGFAMSFLNDGVVVYWDRFGTGRNSYKFTNVGDALAFMTNAPHGDDASDEELDRWERLWEKQYINH